MKTLEAYLAELASESPTPGGGSAAALVAASGAALVAMVARITLENPRYAEHAERARTLVESADELRERLNEARDADEAAYGAVVAASALPKATAEEKAARTSALQRALTGAAIAPLATAELAREATGLALLALALGNEHLITDVACAAEFGATATRTAGYNVRINHVFLKDAALVAEQQARLRAYEAEALEALAHVRSATESKLGAK